MADVSLGAVAGVILRSRDIERLRTFYEQVFHVKFEYHINHGAQHYAGYLGTTLLELYRTVHVVPRGAQDSMILTVSNLEQTLARAESSALYVMPTQTPQGRMALLKDPDGRLVIVMEAGGNSSGC